MDVRVEYDDGDLLGHRLLNARLQELIAMVRQDQVKTLGNGGIEQGCHLGLVVARNEFRQLAPEFFDFLGDALHVLLRERACVEFHDERHAFACQRLVRIAGSVRFAADGRCVFLPAGACQ